MPSIAIVAALDRNRAIGRDNALPWHLPDDFRHFKALTLGKPLLMGSHTARSLGRALPGRRNLVLTRCGSVPFADMQAVVSLDQALGLVAPGEELMVIGGAQVYALALPVASRLCLTRIDAAIDDADTWFPAFDARQWQEQRRELHPRDERHAFAFTFVEYHRT